MLLSVSLLGIYGTHQRGYKCFHPPTQKFYVTIDVTFYEDACYFSPTNTSLQGENHSYFEEMFSDENSIGEEEDVDHLTVIPTTGFIELSDQTPEEVTTSDMTGCMETSDQSPSLLEPTKDYMTSHTEPPGSKEVIYHDHAETLIPPSITVSPLDHGFSGAEDHLEVRFEILSESNNNAESEPTKYVLPNQST